MSYSFANLSTLAANQHYPVSALYVVATPIGNIADISLRALHVLELVDLIACEDTRHTAALLNRYGINKPLLAAHEHNERAAAEKILMHLREGARIALVSDAGTPGISDPGARIVTAVRNAQFPIIPLPGANAALSALAVSGTLLDSSAGAFSFIGFLSNKAQQREKELRLLALHPYPLVLYEAPHRMAATLAALAVCLPDRQLLIGRELTKRFEQIVVCTTTQGPQWLEENAHHAQGEFVLLIEGASTTQVLSSTTAYDTDQLLLALCAELPPAAAARIAVSLTGQPRRLLYARALALKGEEGQGESPA